MDDLLADLQAQQDELAAIVANRSDDDLLAASRCEGWTVADVLLHLAQTNEMAVASVDGRIGEFMAALAKGLDDAGTTVDAWAGAVVDKERGAPRASLERWEASVAAQADAFARCDPSARLTWVAGELAARSLATTRLTEAWIHTVDAAVAYGPPPAPTDRLRHTARLAWRTLPYAFAQAGLAAPGSIRFELEAPGGSTWTFGEDDAPTVLRGTALDLCTVAGQRAPASSTGLTATGPDAQATLAVVRTFA